MPMKTLVIGLDSAPPELLFEEFLGELPNIGKLVEAGMYGRLRSCIPAITIPAWAVMFTGRDPGTLGLYGFRHRRNYSYDDIWIASSKSIKKEAVWDLLSRTGKKVCLVGIPPSYPPKKVNGWMVSCFITPDASHEWTYPPSLKHEITSVVGNYIFDVEFRTERRDKLLEELYEMTEQHFTAVKYLMNSREWDLFAFVEIGLDRVHHAFWRFFDEEHHLHERCSDEELRKYRDVIKNYYKLLDEKVGELLGMLDEDTAVLIVSDHGAKRMKGAFCVNEFLMREGFLRLKEYPKSIVSIEKAGVDWERTVAWGWGGYYARIFLNVEGRERKGIVKPEEYEDVRDELAETLRRVRGPDGEKWRTKVFKPEEIYERCEGDPPDLMVYLDDLSWRSAGTVGHQRLYLEENDTGPDDAVHAEDGVFILYNPRENYGGKRRDLDISEVASVILDIMGGK
ncbi:MAG TPA: nucleotide pyrophosphatase [Methanomicrobia archaeon]|nr:nucleotide pyrophosphatase [Methanomicrobia archaeon]HEX59787.1 nucleotide pyrophosphatase [Methanomicrobia archaeon]